jgi:hypothetical protein
MRKPGDQLTAGDLLPPKVRSLGATVPVKTVVPYVGELGRTVLVKQVTPEVARFSRASINTKIPYPSRVGGGEYSENALARWRGAQAAR